MNDHKHDGARLCARYAFAPNLYKYCGPDTKGEIGEYLKSELVDVGLVEHLSKFEAMYPYLEVIATANGIKDALDTQVVEAYWVGNALLNKVKPEEIHVALTQKQGLKKRLPKSEMRWLLPKIDKGANLNHAFHVFNVFFKRGHHSAKQTVETLDECRISWGQIINLKSEIPSNSAGRRNPKQISGSKIRIKTQKLMHKEGKLLLEPSIREVMLPTEELRKRLKTGDVVSVHWGFVCDKLSKYQLRWLSQLTNHHLGLANETI